MTAPVPTLAMSGERDGCIASDVFERLTVADDFPQGVSFHRISGAGHFLHQEKPEVVNALLLGLALIPVRLIVSSSSRIGADLPEICGKP